MAHIVALPNGDTVEFPDNMTDDQISSIIKTHYTDSISPKVNNNNADVKNPQNLLQKAGNVAGRFNQDIESLPGKAREWAFNTLNQAPSQIIGTTNQVLNPAENINHPGRLLKNLLVGTSNIEKGILNIPYTGSKYLSHLGIISPEQAEKTLHMEKEPVGEYIKSTMGEEQPGDALLQSLPGLAPVIPKGLGATKSAVKAASGLITGAPKYEALKNTLNLAGQEVEKVNAANLAEQAEKEHALATNEEEKAKYAAQSSGLPENPALIENKIGKNQESIDETNKNIQALSHQMDNLKVPGKVEPSDISHIQDVHNASRARQEAEENINRAQEIHQEAQSKISPIDQEIDRHLNQGSDFPVNTSRQLRHELESVNDYWSDEYDNQMKELKNTNFQLMNPERAPQIQEAIQNAKVNYGNDPHGDFARVLKMAPDYRSTDAHTFMMDQKQFRNGINNLYKEAQYAGRNGSPVRADELFRAARALRPFEDLVNQTLEEGLGEYAPRYKDIQNGYRTQVYPLRNNAVAQKVLSGSKMSEDVASELAGDEEGQELLRGMANRNPEIRRNIVGQQYAKNPQSIYNPNERLREYTNNMPETHQLLSNRLRTQESVDNAAATVDRARAQHAEMVQREKEAKLISKEKKEQSGKSYSEYEEKLKKYEKSQNDLQKQLGKHHDTISKLEKEIPIMEKHRDELQSAFDKKGQTLKQKTEAAKNLKEINSKLTQSRSELRKANFGYKKLSHAYRIVRKVFSARNI